MAPRNLEPPELFQMRREPLGVEQCEFSCTQMVDQSDKRDLRCVALAMKHRFAEKRAAKRHAVQSAGEALPGWRSLGAELEWK